MKRVLLAAVLLAGCKAGLNEKNHMTDMPVKKTITATIPSAQQLVVSVRFENVSDFDVFVLKDLPSLFVMSGNTDIDEIGPSEKREEYTLSDYETVAPGQGTVRQQEISSRFEWLPGSHSYEVSVSGNYEDPVDHRTWKGPRVAAQFKWTKQP